jgi:hypothetical protein
LRSAVSTGVRPARFIDSSALLGAQEVNDSHQTARRAGEGKPVFAARFPDDGARSSGEMLASNKNAVAATGYLAVSGSQNDQRYPQQVHW